MELALTVLNQVLVMFVLIVIGAGCFKLKIINQQTSAQLTTLLLYIVNPLVIINSYNMPFDKTLAKNLIIAFGLGVISHLLAMVIAYIFVRVKDDKGKVAIERFSVIYTNCGFMALPLINALFGSEGVFYASAYMTVFNLLSWTHGYMMMAGKVDKAAFKKAFLSPVVISVFVGLIIFFAQIRLPLVIGDSVRHIALLNTPIAMIVTGVSLASGNVLKAFTSLRYYYVVFVSNVLVPLAAIAIYLFLPIAPNIIMVNLVAIACPCAVTTLLFTTKLGKDVAHATNILTLSNVTCVVTIPLIIFLYQALLTLV